MRVVLVPGFTQTAASWGEVVADLHPTVDAVPIDVPIAASFTETARAIVRVHGPAVYVGYSMGGRLALRAALERPDDVVALVLVSSTAGIAEPDERDARVAADEVLARRAETEGAVRFVEQWRHQPLFADVPDSVAARERIRDPDVIARQLRVLGTGAMEPLWDRLGALAMPTWIVTGTRDEKFDAIGDAMAARIDAVHRERIACGHAIPLEAPAALAAIIEHAAGVPRRG